MVQYRNLKSIRRLALASAGGAALLGALSIANAAAAQEAAPAQVEEVVVTGSAIRGREAEALPVTVLDQGAMEARNALTAIELLTALPQIGAIPLGESVSGSLGARGDNSSINMRGIGSNATLVLLNGRRLAPHPISATENGAPSFSVNINQLPTRGLDHVDVLRDGASSIYGSDAVAGVINFVTTTKFRGTEARLRYGYPEEGGGKSWNATVTYGSEFLDGRLRVLTNLDLFNRDAIYLNQRDFSATSNHTAEAPAPFNVAGSVFDGRGANLYPTFRVGTATASTYLRPLAGGAIGFTSVAPTRTANPEAFYDVNAYQQVQPQSTRVNWFSNVEYDLTDDLTAFGDFTVYRAHSKLSRNPVPFNAPNADLLQVVSADNPYNPYGSRFYSTTGAPNADGSLRLVGAPRSVTLQSVLLTDGGADIPVIDSEVYRVVGGIRGSFGQTWNWESGVLYSFAQTDDETQTGFRESLLGDALRRTDATAFNPFGYTFKVVNGQVVPDQPYRNPDSVLATVMRPQLRHGESSVASVDFRANGDLISLWAGEVKGAFGGEFRKETFLDTRPAFFGLNPAGSGLDTNGNDYIQASPKPDSEGDRTVGSLYAEVVAPLATPDNNIPLVYSLEVGASVRYEHYSDFGDTTNPKFSVNYRPIRPLIIRASKNQGFSAPNLATLYFPDQFTVIPAPGSIDPYRNPVTNEGAYVMRNYTGAADVLLPTDSDGKSIGAVFDVPGISAFGSLRVSADYWEIKQTNLIGSPNVTQLLERDAALLRAYTASQLAAGVPIGSIDLGSGTAAYKGDPSVVRNAVSAADIANFAAYNARNPTAQAAAVGQIFGRSSLYQNLSEGFVSGWDYSVEYSAPEFDWGRLRLSVDWTLLEDSYTLLPTNAGPVRQERLNVDGNADSRGSATISWKLDNWSASLSGYYIGAFTESGATTTAAIYNSLGRPDYIVPVLDSGVTSYRYRVKSSTSFNLNLGYDFDDGAQVRFGIVNLFNKQPPLASTNFGYNAAAYTQLAIGRTWTVELSKEF